MTTQELADACNRAGAETVAWLAAYLRQSRGSADDQAYQQLRAILADVLDSHGRDTTGPDERLVEHLRNHPALTAGKLRYWMPLAEHTRETTSEPLPALYGALAVEIDAALFAAWVS